MEAYYADERDRFYELVRNSKALILDAFITGHLRVHYDELRARICSRPIQLPTETWVVVLSMLRSEQASVRSTCKKFRDTFANIYNT
ncbi:hypothetical protein AAVH_28880 [Aphelenchoides avenae]|nr:hypothetical protein AAVH_28880 [Aphelenchus avenae]